jgi:tRNA threonylcarbamoyladenosine biosynthesis protein TsaB
VNVLALDTATPSTAVAVLGAGTPVDLRDDPPPGSRGEHAGRALVLADAALREAGLRWSDLELIAVGTGPGGYTGLRIGIATARGLARARGVPLAGVGTLRALAAPLRGLCALALLDARRGELFAAAYEDDLEVIAPRVIAPAQLPALLEEIGRRPLHAVGDGALAARGQLEALGAEVPGEGSPLHHVSAAAIGALAVREPDAAVTPLYLRRPDAELALGR